MTRKQHSHIIAHISQRAAIDRAEPNDVHTKVLEVVEFGGDACEIASPITICIKERGWINLVDGG